ncbi:adenosylcobinamide-GDP ribazoletransferase [Haloimpatiens sp. FM7330]|uniref:adenosylcobinamide-GDP ribazoletransferase n=1 Tax=Haloimpatiens sp. FM7330 TaxID=3298610 RepID=UPI00363BCDD6
MKEYISDFFLLIQFLTRIPVNKSLPCEKENFKKGAIFFPIIGLIVGGLQWIISCLFSKILPPTITAVLAIAAAILITGGLHVDGWGDVFDGFFSFKGGKEKIIEIMKDSRIGAYAGIAILCNILLKYSAISYLIDKNLLNAIIIAPVVGRCSLIFISYIGKNAKKTGSGNIFIGNMDIKRVVISYLITALITIPLIGVKDGLVIMGSSIIITFLVNKFCEHYIDGLTGDTLGFTNEAVEQLVLVVFIAINM